MSDLISKQDAIDALWKALYEYEDKTEKQFQESDELDVGDWIQHRIFVQNMSDIDRQTILTLPTVDAEPIRHGHWVYKENMGYFCSACMESGLSPTNADDNCGYSLDGTMKYCWNCGAKMETE